jgi:hypothetical protein
MAKIIRLTESDLTRIVKRVIKEQSKQIDPIRAKFFDDLTNKISSKLIGKKIPFGKIGVLDGTSLIIQKYADRNHAVNLKGEQVNDFDIMFYVRRAEEDLNRSEKPGTRIWTGIISIRANFGPSGAISNPDVTLYPVLNGQPKFDENSRMKPSLNLTWDQLGGKDLWMQATKFNKYA